VEGRDRGKGEAARVADAIGAEWWELGSRPFLPGRGGDREGLLYPPVRDHSPSG
jgi:hypothetical protein